MTHVSLQVLASKLTKNCSCIIAAQIPVETHAHTCHQHAHGSCTLLICVCHPSHSMAAEVFCLAKLLLGALIAPKLLQVFPFSSDRKRMSSITSQSGSR